MTILGTNTRSGRRLVVSLSLVSATVLAVPGWIWADCCCPSEFSVAPAPVESSCCHVSKTIKHSRRVRLPRWQSDCRCDADVTTWNATIPVRQLAPASDEMIGFASNRPVQLPVIGSNRVERLLKFPDHVGSCRQAWLCCWLA